MACFSTVLLHYMRVRKVFLKYCIFIVLSNSLKFNIILNLSLKYHFKINVIFVKKVFLLTHKISIEIMVATYAGRQDEHSLFATISCFGGHWAHELFFLGCFHSCPCIPDHALNHDLAIQLNIAHNASIQDFQPDKFDSSFLQPQHMRRIL